MTAGTAEAAPIRAGTIAAAIACIAIAGLGLALSLPLISLRMEAAGFSSFAIGMNAAMAGLSSLVSAPFVPGAAHRVGTRTMLFGALALGAACLVAFPLAPFWAWFPIRFAFGVSITILFVMSEFWITAAAPEARRGLVMGIYATVLALGFAGGPLLLQAVGTQGFAAFVAGAAVFAIAAIPVALAGGNAPDVEGKAQVSILSFLRAAPAATLAGFVYGAVETGAFSLLPVYAEQLGLGAVVATTLVTALSLGHVAFQIPLGWLADRMNRIVVLVACGVVGIAGAAALPFVAPAGGAPLYLLLFVWGGIIAGLYYDRPVAAGPALCRAGTGHGECCLRGALQPRYARRSREHGFRHGRHGPSRPARRDRDLLHRLLHGGHRGSRGRQSAQGWRGVLTFGSRRVGCAP